VTNSCPASLFELRRTQPIRTMPGCR
jgi:hypothetical protein